ncbi:MAG: carbohydrate binding domain-containing protein [Bacteroidaceae bacterium]|nr:carbohydrate binding domain-containing protein [Bacteroidaceae bacterium]
MNPLKHLMLTAALATGAFGYAQQSTINIETSKLGSDIAPTMYGIFFEDINFGADGGLYAELVKNRSFEFSPDHFMGWKVFGNVTLKNDGPFEKNPHYIHLGWTGRKADFTGVQNEGFFGIGVKRNEEYRFTVWARKTQDKDAKIRVQLVNQNTMDNRQEFTSGDITIDSKEWKQYTLRIKSTQTLAKANLRVMLVGQEGVDLEHISLFPTDTWKGRKGGLRKDLAQALYDLHPGVFRFPGGCIVEGVDLNDAYDWKKTVGPVENRPVSGNRWEYTFSYRLYPDYFQTFGLGFYEYFQLSEDIGAEPLPVVNVGMACQYMNWNDEKAHAPLDSLQPFIDNALDLIEFANGSVDTKWGKLRADMGHPAPFNLKYIAVGNEQWEDMYFKRLTPFVKAIRAKYPNIKIIGTSGPDSEGAAFEHGWENMRKQGADLVDEHFYRNEQWFLDNANRYDKYSRKGPKVFAGEYACHGKNKKWNHFNASLYEAAFMTNIEKNADVVRMATYAPLFAHVEGWQWRPDEIWFDNLNSFKTCSYYVQQLYTLNKGTNVLKTTLAPKTELGQDGLFTSAVYDKTTNEVIVKIANTSNTAKPVLINFNGFARGEHHGTMTVLKSLNLDGENSIEKPNAIKPTTTLVKVEGDKFQRLISKKSFVVLRIKK